MGARAALPHGLRVESHLVDVLIDAELLQLAARDDAAFAVIQRQFQRLVWSASYGYQLDRDTRDDIAQLVWMKLFQHLDTIRDPSRLAGWLATTTRRECLRVAKARARLTVTDDFDAAVDDRAPELDANVIRDETVRVVANALGQIDRECQRLLRLLTADPALSYGEIAEALDAAPGSIGPWRQRCLRKLAARPELRRILDAHRDRMGGEPQ